MTLIQVPTQITASIVGDRIELRGSYNEAVNTFYRSLPSIHKRRAGAFWNNKKKCWECLATPGTAWRILRSGFPVAENPELALLAKNILDDENGPGFFNTAQPGVTNSILWKHQVLAFRFAQTKPATMLDVCMGGGKSLVAIALLEYWKCRRVLILCPRAVLGVWRREFSKHCKVKYDIEILDGSQSNVRKTELADVHMTLGMATGDMTVVAINYESSKLKSFLAWACNQKWDAVIADESQKLKSPTSLQSRAAYDIGRHAERRLALTGTPMPHSPLDLYGQFRFLDPGIFGTSYVLFRNKYATLGGPDMNWVTGFQNQQDLGEKMRLLAYEVSDADAELNLPPVSHYDVPVKLCAATRKIYKDLKEQMIAAVKGGVITAANGLVKTLRLAQCTSGYLIDDDDVTHHLGTEKVDALEDLIEGIDSPVIVFCRFRHDLDMVKNVSEKVKRRHGEVSGRRKDLTENAEMPDDIDVLGVQIQAGGVGVSLHRAHYAIFMSHPWSRGDYDQALARLNRPGQKRPVRYYHIMAEDTIDQIVFDALVKKKKIIDEVLFYLRGSIN